MHESVILKGALTFMRRFFEIPIQEFNPMRKLMALAFILATAAPLTAFAQSQEDQTGCTPDVMRLLTTQKHDASRIIACLVRSKWHLSPACSMVFNRARIASVRKTKL